MEILVGKNPQIVADNCSLYDVLTRLHKAHKPGLAVAVNNTVIPSTRWKETLLSPQDQITIITASQGG